MQHWEESVNLGAPAVEPLIAALKHGDFAVRQQARQALEQIQEKR